MKTLETELYEALRGIINYAQMPKKKPWHDPISTVNGIWNYLDACKRADEAISRAERELRKKKNGRCNK